MKKIFTFWKKGDSYILLTGAGLIFSIGMVVIMIGIIFIKGMGFFWPENLTEFKLKNGTHYLGEIWETKDDKIVDANGKINLRKEIKIKSGNRDISGFDFKWLNKNEIEKEFEPSEAVTFERWQNGNLYGFIQSVSILGKNYNLQNSKERELIKKARESFEITSQNREEEKELQSKINDLMRPLSNIQREISLSEINGKESKANIEILQSQANALQNKIEKKYTALLQKSVRLKNTNAKIYAVVRMADGSKMNLPMAKVVRFYQPNKMSVVAKSLFYLKKVWEYLSAEPRESNTEGGVFPAIFGTVLMVLLMSIAVVPFGVMAAIYLNEYAKQGFLTRMIRLSVVNLAGVPSIVFGIFGLGFFIYIIGGTIDQLFYSSQLPSPTFGTGGILWASLTLALLTLPVVVVATEEGLLAVPQANKQGALALGATKWQMIRKVVLPNAMPGILTGMILAISRGAGEVAPLMITGVVKLAPALPLDTTFPFLHLSRKFMHLGFHIYDVGFQSPNVEAALPMVYTTALLLILIVVALNLIAIYFRNNLRKKFKTSAF